MPEPTRARASTRVCALVALAVSVGYLAWRATTIPGADLWIAVPLYVLELSAVVSLGLFTVSLWDLDALVRAAPVDETDLRVAVLIPTYNEPREVLLPTIAAAVALAPAHETWVLDDGDRPWVAQLAATLGADYLAREDRAHAKAGNLNHALEHLDVDVVAVLDADHVAQPDLLRHTLGYFDDPYVALVQTPQDFYNTGSFEHERRGLLRSTARPLYNEQALFYRAIEPGKNRWHAAFWCGTNALVRVEALRDVEGVATDSITEDIETTIRLHRRGWRTAYHNEVLALGLAASDAGEYQQQRLRWGTGAMQVLRTDRPITGPDLSLMQRLAYATTLLGWFESWRSLGYLLLPPAVLLTGAVPLRADLTTFAVLFALTFVAQRLALSRLSRGLAPQWTATVFDVVRMTVNLRATLTILRRRPRRFRVTRKGRSDDGRARVPAPRLLWVVLGLQVVAAAWFAATQAGRTHFAYESEGLALGAVLWLAVNTTLVGLAIDRIRSERFAGERRAGERLHVTLPCTLSRVEGKTLDVSLTGARLLLRDAVPALAQHDLHVQFHDRDFRFVVRTVGRTKLSGAGYEVRCEVLPGQDREVGRLALALLGGAAAERAVVTEPDLAA